VLATVPDPLLDGLVAPTRLGAVLQRRRRAVGETLTAVARRCPPTWTPDRLSEVERGELVPGAELVALVAAYGLAPGRWRPPHELRLVLDRHPHPAATGPGPERGPAHDEPHWQLMRLAAVGVAVGLDGRWTGGRSRLLGEAFGASPRDVAAQLAEALDAAPGLVAGWVDRAAALPVVAAAGVLLARGVGGHLVLTAPNGGAGWDVAPVCRLADLTPPLSPDGR